MDMILELTEEQISENRKRLIQKHEEKMKSLRPKVCTVEKKKYPAPSREIKSKVMPTDISRGKTFWS